MNRSIYIGKIHDIPIEINYTWFVVFLLVMWTFAQVLFRELPHYSALLVWAISVITALLFFAGLLAHELSHSIVATKNNIPINGITLFIFGGVAHITKEPQSPGVEFKMAIAGPLCSFGLSVAFFVLFVLFSNLGFSPILIIMCKLLYELNLAIGIFNLIPGFPLDGGRILRSALWSLFGDIKRATGIASSIGKAFAYFLMSVGFLYLFYGLTLSGIWLMFIGFFLQEAASASYQQVTMRKFLSGTKVRDLMTKNVISVSEDLPLLSLVDDYFFKYRVTSFPVLSRDDEIEGLITIHRVKDMPKQEWNSLKVKDAMVPMRSDLMVDPNKDIFEALTQMAGNEVGRLIVTDGRKVIGIISQRDIIRLFEVKDELGG